jgi:outer membrane protein, multidrug efflux system
MDRVTKADCGRSRHRQAVPSAAVILAAVLTACTHQSREPSRPPATPATFRETDPAIRHRPAADMPANGAWWLVFSDPQLDALILRADRNNFTIGSAQAQLAGARAIQQDTVAAQWPTLTLSANSTRAEGPLTNAASGTGPLYVVGANLSYEADVFGRLAREGKAASMVTAEQEELLRAAKLLVQANIAQTYFALRALDAERALLRSAAESHLKSARLTEGLFRSGLASELAFVRLRAEAEADAAEALTLDQRRAELEHGLAVLVGGSASTFWIAPTKHSGPVPNIPPGIPATVLVRRPDVGAARQAVIAAQIRTGVAEDRWLPTLSLTAFGGFASSTVGSLLSGSAAGSTLGALLSLPIFDGGRYRAGVAKANADLDAAAASYGQQILVAFKDVEDQLSALRLLARQEVDLKRASDAALRTTALVASNYKDGLASQIELLDAERVELRDRRQLSIVHAARFQATVGLIKALGGGWDVAAPSSKAPSHGPRIRKAHHHTRARGAR